MGLLGYTRSSAPSQDMSQQIRAMVSAGVHHDAVYSDVSLPDRKASVRQGMSRLLEDAREGDTIVVWRIDRLGASLTDVLATVSILVERGIQIRSVVDCIDPSTAQGRLMLNLLCSLAEYDRHLASERIAAGMASSRQTGTTLGRPPADPKAIREKVRAVEDARARGLTAADAAQTVGWSRATFYRHQQRHGSER